MENNQAYFEEDVFEMKNAKGTIKRFLRSLGTQKVRLVMVLFSVVFYTIFTIMAPLYSANVVDTIWNTVKEAQNNGTIFRITWENVGYQILLLLLLYGAAGLFYALQKFLMASFAEKLNLHFREEISKKFQRLPLAYYDRHQTGEMMSHVTNDLEKMSEALQTGFLNLFIAIGTILGSVVIMFHFSFVLTMVFLVFTGLSIFLTKMVSRKTLQYAAKRQECVGKLTGLIEEVYTGRTIVKAFHYEKPSLERVKRATEKLARATEKTDFMIYAINPGIRIVNRCGQVMIAVLGGMMLFDGRISPGKFQAFFQYVTQAGEPLTEMSYMINSMQSALASVERVYAILDEEEITPEPALPAVIKQPQGHVCFRDVQFGYTPEKILMRGINFSAKPGQKIAIVGSTGAGKTTLVNLLMRFYEINSGKILLDGVDTQSLTRADLRSSFGMVLQDTWLFGGTIAENIAYGKPKATRNEIVTAAQAARADFFIRTLPQGYDTVLSNDAENISAGQRQLLTIARVMLCNPAILILDEATSSVDTRTEMEIGKAMNTLMANRTSFVIAHRLSTIVDADLILVMRKGNIIEQGNHKELLAAHSSYAELYNSQFA
ncbi:MAG: ABC transporter ATP-binding protein [Planctomycetia bacterium]|nr:ABC transporter ATP-binding protein [Planctomycetia bacterium]